MCAEKESIKVDVPDIHDPTIYLLIDYSQEIIRVIMVRARVCNKPMKLES